jgi:3-dehydroquinate dehydratase-2
MKILVINGPNLNMLGIREPAIYGTASLDDLCALIQKKCDAESISVEFFQSNHEGALIDKIHEAYQKVDGIVINPAGYTHTSIALLDALKAVGIPAVEVHISDITRREDFRKQSFVRKYCFATVAGRGFEGYLWAIDTVVERCNACKN